MKKIIAVAAGLLGALAAGVLVVALSAGSSHREAPSSTRDPQADWTDVYAFTAREAPNALTIVGNLDPFQLPQGGPNYNSTFDPKARYYVNVDNTGDGKVDVRYRFEFKDDLRGTADQGYPHSLPTVDSVQDPDFAFRQRYTVVEQRFNRRGRQTRQRTVANSIVVPGNVGPKTMPNYDAVVQSGMGRLRGGGRVFVGARDDPFFIDLGGAFDSINLCRGTGNEGGCRDDLAGFNVNSIVLQLPEALVTRDRQNVTGPSDSSAAVGVWTSTDRQRLQVSNSSSRQTRRSQVRRRGDAGWTQVNRLGNPLVNEPVSYTHLTLPTTPYV